MSSSSFKVRLRVPSRDEAAPGDGQRIAGAPHNDAGESSGAAHHDMEEDEGDEAEDEEDEEDEMEEGADEDEGELKQTHTERYRPCPAFRRLLVSKPFLCPAILRPQLNQTS